MSDRSISQNLLSHLLNEDLDRVADEQNIEALCARNRDGQQSWAGTRGEGEEKTATLTICAAQGGDDRGDEATGSAAGKDQRRLLLGFSAWP